MEEITNVGCIRNPLGWVCLEKQMEFVAMGDSQVHVGFSMYLVWAFVEVQGEIY